LRSPEPWLSLSSLDAAEASAVSHPLPQLYRIMVFPGFRRFRSTQCKASGRRW
jgi:hypothetical protein